MVNFDRSQYVERRKLKGKLLEGKYQGRSLETFHYSEPTDRILQYREEITQSFLVAAACSKKRSISVKECKIHKEFYKKGFPFLSPKEKLFLIRFETENQFGTEYCTVSPVLNL